MLESSEGLELVVEGSNRVARRNVASTGNYKLFGVNLGSSTAAKAVTLGGASAVVQAVAVVAVVATVAVVSVGAASGWDYDFSDDNVTASPTPVAPYDLAPEPTDASLEEPLDGARMLL